jgi:hypothetical protein
MTSPAGGPVFSMPPLWRWTSSNYVVIGVVFILLGLCLVQFGGKYYMVSMCIIAAFLMTSSLMCVMYGMLLPNETP